MHILHQSKLPLLTLIILIPWTWTRIIIWKHPRIKSNLERAGFLHATTQKINNASAEINNAARESADIARFFPLEEDNSSSVIIFAEKSAGNLTLNEKSSDYFSLVFYSIHDYNSLLETPAKDTSHNFKNCAILCFSETWVQDIPRQLPKFFFLSIYTLPTQTLRLIQH